MARLGFSSPTSSHCFARPSRSSYRGKRTSSWWERPETGSRRFRRAIHRGEMHIPPGMVATLLSRLLHRRREQDEALRRVARLTRREREVLALLAEGADNDAIAR